jgi:raffinose/stachyose/melibiose transport system permease protein
MKRGKFEWLWKLGLGAVALLWMVPLVYMVSMSFRPAELAFEPVLFLPPVVDTNYRLVLSQSSLGWNFLSSAVVTVSTVILVALFASMATFGLTRREIVHKKLIYNLLMITLMVPISALVIPLAQINSRLGWLNRYQGLIPRTRRWASPLPSWCSRALWIPSPRSSRRPRRWTAAGTGGCSSRWCCPSCARA